MTESIGMDLSILEVITTAIHMPNPNMLQIGIFEQAWKSDKTRFGLQFL
jgi:hypothetical protein